MKIYIKDTTKAMLSLNIFALKLRAVFNSPLKAGLIIIWNKQKYLLPKNQNHFPGRAIAKKLCELQSIKTEKKKMAEALALVCLLMAMPLI